MTVAVFHASMAVTSVGSKPSCIHRRASPGPRRGIGPIPLGMAGSETFRTWLLRQADRQDSVGDLARELKDDADLPHPLTPKALLEHVEDSSGIQGAIDAVREAAAEFGEPLPDEDDEDHGDDEDHEDDGDEVHEDDNRREDHEEE